MTLRDRAQHSTELARKNRIIEAKSRDGVSVSILLDEIARALSRLDATMCLVADELLEAHRKDDDLRGFLKAKEKTDDRRSHRQAEDES